MTRPPSESPGAARLTWAAALVLAAGLGVAVAGSPWAAARWGVIVAAAAAAAVAVLLLLILIRLQSRHRAAVRAVAERAGETGHLSQQLKGYAAELAQYAAENEHLQDQLQRYAAELDQREDQRRADASARAAAWDKAVDQLVTVALPHVLSGAAGPLPEAAAFGEGELADLCEQVLAAVSDGVAQLHADMADERESARLAVVALARRVQASAHRIQEEATRMAQRHPADPDVLESSMRVDHAAAQQARHAQSMAVLSGEWPGQQWAEPLALVDVARAAAGRIVPYQRVTVSGEPDVAAAPEVAEPLIHLVAELLANATQSSPPSSQVLVTVRTVQRGAVIEIDDGGVGMDDHRLAQAREVASGRCPATLVTLGEIPQTGLAVVGQYARRHGLGVDLVPSPYGGIRAVTLVPAELVQMLDPVVAAPARQPAHARKEADLARKPAAGGAAGAGGGGPLPEPAAGPLVEAATGPLTTSPAGPQPGRAEGLPRRRARRAQAGTPAGNPPARPAARAAAPPVASGAALPGAPPGAAAPLPAPAEVGAWMGAFLSAGVPADPDAGTGPAQRQE